MGDRIQARVRAHRRSEDVTMRTDAEKVARMREILSLAKWEPTDTQRMRLELLLVLDDKLTEYDQLQLQPDATKVTILARPGSYRTLNITDGSRVAHVTLSVEGGHIAARVDDEHVAPTATLLTGRDPCLVTCIVEHAHFDDGAREVRLLVRSVEPAPSGTKPIRPFMEVVGGSGANQEEREALLKLKEKLTKRMVDLDRRLMALVDGGAGPVG